MEIIGRIAVNRNKKENRKKTWLTIGLVAFALTMICEVLLGNFAFLALIVPFLYLLNLRNKMGKNALYKDVAIRVEDNDIEKIIEISNCEYRNNILCSARFLIRRDAPINLSYFTEEEKIIISCTAKKILFVGESIMPIFDERPYDVLFHITLADARKIADLFNETLVVKG